LLEYGSDPDFIPDTDPEALELRYGRKIIKICRAYGYTPAQVYEMDYLMFNIALGDLLKCPLIDEAFFRSFCVSEKPLTIQQRRDAIARSK